MPERRNRRIILQAAGTSVSTALAGCLSFLHSEDDKLSVHPEYLTDFQPSHPWPMSTYDARASRHNPGSKPPLNDIGIAWSKNLGSASNDSLLPLEIVADDRHLYVAFSREIPHFERSDENIRQGRTREGAVLAVDGETGETSWTISLLEPGIGGISVHEGTVYVTTNSGRPDVKYLVALDSTSGSEQWRTGFSGREASHPVVYDGLVYVVSNHEAGGVFAFDPSDRTQLWTQPLTIENGNPSLAVADELVITATGHDGGQPYAFDASSGDLAWNPDIENVFPFPSVGNQTAYFPQEESLVAIGLDGAIRWQVPLENEPTMPVLVDDHVLTTSGENVVAFDSGGDEQWRYTIGGTGGHGETYAAAGGTLFLQRYSTHVAVNVSEGTRVWNQDLSFNYQDRDAAGEASLPILITAYNMLYIANNDGWLYALGGSDVVE